MGWSHFTRHSEKMKKNNSFVEIKTSTRLYYAVLGQSNLAVRQRRWASELRYRRTVVQNRQKSGRKYWATRLSVRLFSRTAHARSALLALHCSLAHLLIPELMGK